MELYFCGLTYSLEQENNEDTQQQTIKQNSLGFVPIW